MPGQRVKTVCGRERIGAIARHAGATTDPMIVNQLMSRKPNPKATLEATRAEHPMLLLGLCTGAAARLLEVKSMANTTVGEGCGAPGARQPCLPHPGSGLLQPVRLRRRNTSREESADPNRASGSNP
jgi:hypothetical protein